MTNEHIGWVLVGIGGSVTLTYSWICRREAKWWPLTVVGAAISFLAVGLAIALFFTPKADGYADEIQTDCIGPPSNSC